MSKVTTNKEASTPKEESTFNFPTEVVELPSKGLVYPEDSPLAEGKITMKYMTAKEEDIITNQNYIQKGTAIDHLLNALIVTPGVKQDELITGDKNAILIAARILGYGANYKFDYLGDEVEVDLSKLENKEIDYSLIEGRTNEFEFTLPHTQTPITFRLLTGKIEKQIDGELKGLAKINKIKSAEMSTRMKHLIASVNGDSDRKTVRQFVDTALLARDAKSLRDHIAKMQPDIEIKFDYEDYNGEIVEREIPITSGFFFPDPE
jgi:hypothetical protein